MKKKVALLLMVGISAVVISVAAGIVAGIRPAFETRTVELGEEIDFESEVYFEGYKPLTSIARVSSTEVDLWKPGSYKVTATLLGRKYDFEYQVEDTTAPCITLKSDIGCLSTKEIYNVEDFVESVSDKSGEIEVYVVEDKVMEVAGLEVYNESDYCGDDQITFDEGENTLIIAAKDPYGNETRKSINVMADIPPALVGVYDRYIKVGSEFDPLEFVKAVDNNDGIITDSIRVFETGIDTEEEGTFKVNYSVTDSNGLLTEKEATIYVGDETRPFELDRDEVKVLCDNGYFRYEPLEEEDYEKTLETVTPTLVNLRCNFSNGAWRAGSGFVYKVTADNVYFVSVDHVTKNVNNNVDLMFFNGKSIRVDYDPVLLSKENEIVMFSIPTEEIPAEVLLDVKETHCDEEIYENLEVGANLFQYSPNWQNEKPVIYTKKLKAINEEFTSDSRNCVSTTRGSRGGMSGTAVYDFKGNLVSVCKGYRVTDEGVIDYSLMITDLDELYGRITA